MMDLPYRLATQRAPQIGLIVLQADETLERDMRLLLPSEAETLVSRVASAAEVTPDTLAAMEPRLKTAAGLFPTGARFSAIAYGCTSGTAQIGAARIRTMIEDVVARADASPPPVTDPIAALLAACAHLRLRRIGLISPYIQPVSERLQAVLQAAGIAIAAFASFNQAQEAAVARIDPQAVLDAACTLHGQGACEAIFLSCTNLRTLEILAEAERRTGKPVLSSNQVLGWHLSCLAGLDAPAGAPGRLFERPGAVRP
ncbi:MAG: Asp/Glu racemase [Pseudomonadota bacterium]